MIIIRWFWFLTGVFVLLQYGYWALLEVGYGLSLCDAPTVTHVWLFLAFLGAAISSADRLGPELKKLL
jgi:hypothetical protein